MDKKKLIFLGLDVLVLVLTIGVSLAVFNYARKGEEKNSVKVGAITMRYSEVSRKISIVDATPMEDEKGKVLNEDEEGNKLYFDFTVEASMSVKNPITYEVTLEKDKETTLEDEYVRIYLEKKDSEGNYIEVLSPTNFVEIGEDDELGAKSTEMLLTTGEVTNNVIDYYRLRLWVDKDYTYSSSEKEFVATVNVYARNIEINKAERIELSTNSLTIQKGETKKISATIKPDNTKNKNIIFESNNQEIVKVDSIGNITAIGVGSAIVTARTSDGDIKAECAITVVNYDAKGVTLNTNNVALSKGNTYQLTSIVTPTDASDTSITYKSSSEGIATISNNGLITAVGVGETTIIVETINGYTDTCKVIVTEPNVTNISINGDDSVDVGSTIQLSTTITSDSLESSNVVWTSSDESKATISSAGKVTGLSTGSVTITAYIKEYPDIKATKTIEVEYSEIKTITMSSDMTINYGNTTTFSIWISPNQVRNQDKIRWISSNTSVAAISSNCLGSLSCTIDGISNGTTTIKAVVVNIENEEEVETTILDTATLNVEEQVSSNVSSIELDNTEIKVAKGGTRTINATIKPEYKDSSEDNRVITWASSDESIATVSESGKVTGVTAGTATITATSGGVSSRCRVTVVLNRDTSGANEPELRGEMVPVRYDTTKSAWVKADKYDWYDYDSLEWANAVTLTSAGRNNTYNVGDVIPSNVINAYWVWIPRYSYTIKCTSENTNCYGHTLDSTGSTPSQATPGAIDIQFESGTSSSSGSGLYTGETATNYFTPPGFTFGNKDLKGVWVSKFELTGTTTVPTSLPGVSSLRSQSVKSFYTTIQTYMNGTNGSNTYGLSGNYDTHMSKNSEWSLMEYLSQSKYGKYGNSNYSGVNKEIYKNVSTDYITGCSSGAPHASASSAAGCTNTYTTKIGQGASTTGNIYGIYDASGGGIEFVMAAKETNTSGFSTSEFNALSPKYLDLYSSYDVTMACGGSVCRGQNLNTTNGWYGYSVQFVHSGEPWLFRPGVFGNGNNAGPGVINVSARISLSAY